MIWRYRWWLAERLIAYGAGCLRLASKVGGIAYPDVGKADPDAVKARLP